MREPVGERQQGDGTQLNLTDRVTADREELLQQAQGTWEMQVTETPDPTDRMVKEIKGNTETFSIYKNNTLTYQQVVDFDIDVRDGVAVFTMRNMRVTAGTRKGYQGSGQFSYTFQIRDDKWIEAQGLIDGDGAAPRLSIYQRVDSESSSAQSATDEATEQREDEQALNRFEPEVESAAAKPPRPEDEDPVHHNGKSARIKVPDGAAVSVNGAGEVHVQLDDAGKATPEAAAGARGPLTIEDHAAIQQSDTIRDIVERLERQGIAKRGKIERIGKPVAFEAIIFCTVPSHEKRSPGSLPRSGSSTSSGSFSMPMRREQKTPFRWS